MGLRNLVVLLGDQLDTDSAAFDGFDPRQDAVWMAEVSSEAEHVWSHKARIALFLSAMRHFRDRLRARGIEVYYRELTRSSLGGELALALDRLCPKRVIVVEPGEWRVRRELLAVAPGLEIRPDRHFLCSREEFESYAKGRRELRMEFFYRQMRRKHRVLVENGRPVGGAWNFDSANRGSFPKAGPGRVPPPRSFSPDAVTRDVLALVEKAFPGHPGSLKRFDWPVTRPQVLEALQDFIENRLVLFGRFQDAMWANQPVLYHSRLSAALNLKLLDPREVVEAAVRGLGEDDVPMPSREGFVRQILGWREFVRGVYWRFMPSYAESNALGAELPLPAFYWTGETEMNCLREVLCQTLEYGYAHHIQRLMVTGLYALLAGVRPVEIHKWYLAIYVDAVEWVELPNVIGMSQYADGGIVASKPYGASGKYIQKMSNYCGACRFVPDRAVGAEACPLTTLYWDFLDRHEILLRRNPRMALQLRNLDRLGKAERRSIRRQAQKWKGG